MQSVFGDFKDLTHKKLFVTLDFNTWCGNNADVVMTVLTVLKQSWLFVAGDKHYSKAKCLTYVLISNKLL